jgi:hypothetical protein
MRLSKLRKKNTVRAPDKPDPLTVEQLFEQCSATGLDRITLRMATNSIATASTAAL